MRRGIFTAIRVGMAVLSWYDRASADGSVSAEELAQLVGQVAEEVVDGDIEIEVPTWDEMER